MKTLLCGAAALALVAGSANAAFLVSGSGEGSTYKNGYAGPIVSAVSPITEGALYGDVEDRDGNGTLGNLATVAATTGDIAFGIGQGNIVAKSAEVANGDVCIIRADLESEYTFLFSNNGQLDDWGAIRSNWGAGRITIFTSATSSGSLGTLEEIKAATGFTDAKVEVLPSWDAVIREVERNPRAVGFTHRYADPSGFLNDLVDDNGFTVTGLAERALRSQTHANGEPVYTVNMEVPYDVYRFNTAVNTTPSMGTPVVLFGNCPAKFGGEAEFVEQVYEEIRAIPAEDLAVDLGMISSIINSIASTGNSVTSGDTGWTFFDDMVQQGGDLLK